MLHIAAVSFPAGIVASIATLLTIGLGIGAGVEYYKKKDGSTAKKYLISSGTFLLVCVIATIIAKIFK